MSRIEFKKPVKGRAKVTNKIKADLKAKRSSAAKRAWATMRKKYGKNFAQKIAAKAWKSRRKNEKKAA